MRSKVSVTMALWALVILTTIAHAQHRAPNVLWARSTAGAQITLDGVLNEPVWAKAESIRVQYGKTSGLITGSGWRKEVGVDPTDPTDATLKFLVVGNVLYMAAVVKDSSVGGGLFNRFDGFLMNIRRHELVDRPAPPFEYFYGWVTEPWADTTLGLPGKLPGFFGFAGGPRDATTSAIWDAKTTVQGTSNDDATVDKSWTTEVKFNLTERGYDVTKPQGDIVEFNISIYDADWQWPVQSGRFAGNRVWWEGPWGNASAYDIARIHARPDITVNTVGLPEVGPDLIIPNGTNYTAPVIDGKMDEAVWNAAPGLDIRYGDDALRNSYPGLGKWRSGQFQPEIGGGRATVLDPGDATIKYFFKGNTLYLGADVRDQAVWSIDNFDQWDGIKFIINDRGKLNPDEFNLERRELTVRFDPTGKPIFGDFLPFLIDSLKGAKVSVGMKPNTTINNFNDTDQGFWVEMAIDLSKLGYPPGRGDGLLFISATLYDGDSFANAGDNYGERTWWQREGGFNAGPAWAYMDPFTVIAPPPTATVLERPDVIWARNTSDPITLDGKLDEAAWSKAESITLKYGDNNHLIPGSGWRKEAGVDPSDPTDATFRFLVNGTNLYVAATVKDSSVGGGLFNRFDGFLMNLRRHEVPDRPAPPFEYFYGWVTEPWADTTLGLPGKLPGFFGFLGGPRDATNSQVWDAVTTVQGTSNDDATIDQGYTTEFKFGLTARGYNVTRAQGDIVEFNVSVYDADWQWPLQAGKFSGNRAWLQGPWGNASAYDVLRVYVRPDVTINSGAVPLVGPELVIPNGGTIAAPTIDGKLDERAWQGAYSLDIRYGDDALRNSYPGIGPWRSGQFQPEIGGNRATVLDPGDATIKMFFKDDWLYLAADVRDQAVTSNDNFDQWDGIKFIINDRKATNPDEFNLERRELTVRFDPTGKAILGDYLPFLVDSLKGAQVGFSLKPGTTINNANDSDKGYNIELAINLTRLGYPAGRGDGVLFVSATLFDGDEFINAADNYGTRTWWMREGAFNAAPVWAYMDPTRLLTGVASRNETVPLTFALLGNYPNPFNPSTKIQFTMPEPGAVTLKVFDVLGRSVKTIPLGLQEPGKREVLFAPEGLSTGVYLYRLEMKSASGNRVHSTLYGKLMFVK